MMKRQAWITLGVVVIRAFFVLCFTCMTITINTNSLFYPGIIDLTGEMAVAFDGQRDGDQ